MDARLQYLTTQDGVRLYYELWVPGSPRANIIFVHGLGDHLGRYVDMAKYLTQRGFGLCMYDQRGHGRSGGRRAHCRHFSDYLKDLSNIIEMVHGSYPNVPIFLIGHSFGGQVVLNFVAKYSKGLRGIIAVSPNIEPVIKVAEWKKKMAAKVSRFLPTIRFSTDIDPAYFSHDPDVVERTRKDPLMNWHVTARLGTEILENTEQLPRLAYQVKVPALFLLAGDDRICSTEASRKFYHSLLIQNKDMRIYHGFYHELLNEKGRESVFKDIESWLGNQISAFRRIAGAAEEGNMYGTRETPDLWHHLGGNAHTA